VEAPSSNCNWADRDLVVQFRAAEVEREPRETNYVKLYINKTLTFLAGGAG